MYWLKRWREKTEAKKFQTKEVVSTVYNKRCLFCFPDQWIHIAVTYSVQSGQAKIFINGNMNKQAPGSGRLSEDWDSYAAFGKHEGSVTDIDTLDEVYMYSRELLPFEVKTLYDNCNFGSATTRE